MKPNKIVFAIIAAVLVSLSSCVVAVRDHPYHHHHYYHHHDYIIVGQNEQADSTGGSMQAGR